MIRTQDCVLGETLYEGSDTVVRRAIYKPSREHIIVKMPNTKNAAPRVVGRLLHEYRILRRLESASGVVRTRGLEHEDGQTALFLEDQGLRSLDRVLEEEGRLPLRVGLEVALDITKVLDNIHAAGVVHKDIKPQNILWDMTQSRATLLDFAISSELSEEATNASTPEALEGTLAYISPEQTGRTARGLDARTDLYSLGVLFFEVLSGRRPFLETDALSLVHAHLAKMPPSLEILVPNLPPVVAHLVSRCIEKHPEKRYQTAKGLQYDIERCLSELSATGTINDFPLGQKDFSPTLFIPQTLVSREKESGVINAAFERAADGAVEVLLLGGISGVGKTALVRSVYREIAKAGRGLLLSGKHDQLGRSVPYAAIAQAFGGWLRNLAKSPKPVFEMWKKRIEQALGPLSRVIADVVPELEWLMGPLAPVPVVPTEMTYNRLKLSWIEFLRVVTDSSPPLVLFLDDMQWVDPASIELLKTLLTDVGRKHFLVIAAYRDNEVDAAHPLWKLVDTVETSGVAVPRLSVGALHENAVRSWLALTLNAEVSRVAPLADSLNHKAKGNPFFLSQLLLELHRQKRVRRNFEDGSWVWDADAVERAEVTGNIVELMRRKVEELPASTQVLLGHAACAGHTFLFSDLAVLADATPADVVRDLQPALLAGLLIPLDGQYREVHALVDASQNSEVDAGYRFLHDRVQQAFYEKIAPERRSRTHLAIGRRMRAVFDKEGGSNQKLLELTRHLNLAMAAISTEQDRKDLARLNLRAAKAAKVNGSYQLQAVLVDDALVLLGEKAWQEEPALAVELTLERIEADFMLKAFDGVLRRVQAFLDIPLPVLPRLAAQELRVRACLASGQYAEGEQLGITALAEQGIRFPESNDECIGLALQLIGECDAWLDSHPSGFEQMPADPSVEHLICDALEAAMLTCAAMGTRPALAALVLGRNTKQTMDRGLITPASPFFITLYASGRSAFTGDHRGSARFARQGMDAAARLNSPFFPECASLCGMYVSYEQPVDRSRVYHEAAIRAAAASGSFQGTSWGLLCELCHTRLWRGESLSQVASFVASQRGIMARSGDASGMHHFELSESYIGFLRNPENWATPAAAVCLRANADFFMATGDGLVAELARIMETHLLVAFGLWSRALSSAEEADRYRPAAYGNPPTTDIALWAGIAAAKVLSTSQDEKEREGLLKKLNHGIERCRYFAEGASANFEFKLRLLEAEHARILGKTDEAMAKYDEAITLARREGFLHIEALSALCCAEFHFEAGRDRIGALYIREAHDAYRRWDAQAIVTLLEARYPEILIATITEESSPRAGNRKKPSREGAVTLASTTTSTQSLRNGGAGVLDFGSLMKASFALTSEIVMDRLLGRLVDIMVENAGAQHGALILEHDGELLLEAQRRPGEAEAGICRNTPIATAHHVCEAVVRLVLRTEVPVVLADASDDGDFTQDPYIRGNAVRSVLCTPIKRSGRPIGVVYLENNLGAGSFTADRIRVLELLAAQAAISIENARLYETLEQRVRQRTEELYRSNDELSQTLKRLQATQKQLILQEKLASLGAVTAGIAHEIKNPLNFVNNFAASMTEISIELGEMIESQRARLDPETIAEIFDIVNDLKENAKRVEHHGQRADGIVRGMIAHSRGEPSEMQEINVNTVVSQHLELSLAENRNSRHRVSPTLETVYSPDLPPVMGSAQDLGRVVVNLVQNALHALLDKQKMGIAGYEPLLRVSTALVDGRIEIHVFDNGVGVKPEARDRMFDPFFTTRPTGEGTGLGLSISHELVVHRHGGELRFDSELGAFTEFVITLDPDAPRSLA